MTCRESALTAMALDARGVMLLGSVRGQPGSSAGASNLMALVLTVFGGGPNWGNEQFDCDLVAITGDWPQRRAT